MSLNVPQGMTQPQNLDAEGVVLSQAILDESGISLDEARSVLGSDGAMFASSDNADIFETLCVLQDSGSKISLVTVAHHLRDRGRLERIGGTPYLARIIDTTPARHAVIEHATIIRDQARLRQIIHISDRARAEAYVNRMPEGGVQAFAEEVEQAISSVAHSTASEHLRPLRIVLGEVHQNVLAAFESGKDISGISTGFKEIDHATKGLQNGDLRIVAGRPGMGKTAWMLNECKGVAEQGYAAAFFSLEMPAIQLAMRFLSQTAKIELSQIRGGRIDRAAFDRYTAAMNTLSELPIFIDDTPELTVFELRARVKRLQLECQNGKHAWVKQGSVGGVWADYLQLMKGRASHSREQEIASITRDLKGSAKTLKVAITAGCQLNRNVEQRTAKEPTLGDLRESGAIENDADLVLMPYRPAYYKPDDPELHGWADIIIAKQRNGPTGKRRVAFVAEYASFANLAVGYEEFDDFGDPHDQ